MPLRFSLLGVVVEQPVHVVTVLIDGVFHASYVQPADDHAEELERGRDTQTERNVTRRQLRRISLVFLLLFPRAF